MTTARSSLRPRLLALAVLLATASPALHAQSTTGAIAGLAPPSAQRIFVRSDTGLTREVTVDARGRYTFEGLYPPAQLKDGGANPVSAAVEVRRIANELGLSLKVVAVVGDDVLDVLRPEQVLDNGQTLGSLGARLISANAYLGVDGILQALRAEADVVITGRVADPSLFLAPQMFAFGWAADDWLRLGRGTLVGHLLECAGQVSGGYFADPATYGVSVGIKF